MGKILDLLDMLLQWLSYIPPPPTVLASPAVPSSRKPKNDLIYMCMPGFDYTDYLMHFTWNPLIWIQVLEPVLHRYVLSNQLWVIPFL